MPATVAACTIVAASLLLPAISVGASPPTRADGARPGARGAGASAGARAAVVGGQTSSIQDIPFQVTLYDPQVLPGPGEVA
ncbi:MAG TPA: hypothetical protein VMG80_00975, partial [Solirubrobacteraceae bacterium]|nr:hypothetical protein [Solirubrobacteraceae bacterium]